MKQDPAVYELYDRKELVHIGSTENLAKGLRAIGVVILKITFVVEVRADTSENTLTVLKKLDAKSEPTLKNSKEILESFLVVTL